ncbi:MAG: hypothetical protein K5651_01405 [Bacteroidales bacterium]|nr:hypothetical protein [Bacteroidales bacterium]
MKKFLVILASVIAAAVTLSLTTSCQKDINLAKSLVGTTWYASEGTDTYHLKFDSQAGCTMNIFDKDGGQKQYDGTFVLTGAKSSLTGEMITVTLTMHGELVTYDGKFNSETELRLDNRVFTKGLL